MKTTDLSAERNERYRFFKQFNRESVLVSLVVITLLASTISWFRAERAIDAANQANATAQTWQTMYKETERECRLAQMEIDDFRILLAKAGITDHVGVKP